MFNIAISKLGWVSSGKSPNYFRSCSAIKNVSGLIVALCGDMLRECLTVNDQLVKILLYDEKRRFYSIFEYVNHDAFDIASDAFRTFRVSVSQLL